jgi:hypothetical protein
VTYTPGEGRAHEFTHIAKISSEEPYWLPETIRTRSLNQYVFRCGRCNSFPTMYWPSEGGAYSGMQMHLAVAHFTGTLATSGPMLHSSVKFDMVPIREPVPAPESVVSPWVPSVAMSSARPAVFMLAQALAMNDIQVRTAIAELVRLSDTPPVAQAQHMTGREQDVMARPWKWLSAVMREAQESGDYALTAAGLLWALHWTTILVPKLDSASFMELGLHPIPAPLKGEIQEIGLGALSNLPSDFVVAGDETGQMLAGHLAKLAGDLLR